MPDASSATRVRAAVERWLAAGYSTCYRCGRPWKFAKEHMTDYSFSNGCFPLCERCWTDLGTPEARLPYYWRLAQGWASRSSNPDEVYRDTWPAIRKAVEAGK